MRKEGPHAAARQDPRGARRAEHLGREVQLEAPDRREVDVLEAADLVDVDPLDPAPGVPFHGGPEEEEPPRKAARRRGRTEVPGAQGRVGPLARSEEPDRRIRRGLLQHPPLGAEDRLVLDPGGRLLASRVRRRLESGLVVEDPARPRRVERVERPLQPRLVGGPVRQVRVEQPEQRVRAEKRRIGERERARDPLRPLVVEELQLRGPCRRVSPPRRRPGRSGRPPSSRATPGGGASRRRPSRR